MTKPRDQQFKKYQDKGAYHWKIYERGILSKDLRLQARYNIVVKLLKDNNFLDKGEGLDVGTGDGVFLYKVRKEGGHIVGLDNSEEGIKLAKENLNKKGFNNVKIVNSSCFDTPFSNNSFDYVTAIELIEHLEKPEFFLKEVKRILKPDGVFICTTPNRYEAQAPDEVIDKYHHHEYIPEELTDLLESHLKDVKVFGAYPTFLEKICRDEMFGKLNFIAKVNRVLVRLFSLVYNPYEKIKSNPDFSQRLLIGIGYSK